jgi:hypothetical protein
MIASANGHAHMSRTDRARPAPGDRPASNHRTSWTRAPTVVAPARIIATDIGYQRPARNDGEGVR